MSTQANTCASFYTFDHVFGHNSVKNAFKTQSFFDFETVYLQAQVISFEISLIKILYQKNMQILVSVFIFLYTLTN